MDADTPLQPPFFMKKEVMAETAQLEEFDEALYHVRYDRLARLRSLALFLPCLLFASVSALPTIQLACWTESQSQSHALATGQGRA